MSKTNILKNRSLQQKNMECIPYMILHRRMYAVVDNGNCYICLTYLDDSTNRVSLPVTREAFNEYLSYEIDFKIMLDIFAALCMKFSYVPF